MAAVNVNPLLVVPPNSFGVGGLVMRLGYRMLHWLSVVISEVVTVGPVLDLIGIGGLVSD